MAPFASQATCSHQQATTIAAYATRRYTQTTLFKSILSRNMEQKNVADTDRIVVSKRVYAGEGVYSDWEHITVGDILHDVHPNTGINKINRRSEYVINLKHGGTLRFIPKLLGDEGCRLVKQSMEKQIQYLQYYIPCRAGLQKEPRVHVLLSPKVGTGYQYHK